MMIMVQVPQGLGPRQVDDFPAECERSKKGSVHFRTNSTITITQDEYNHVLKSHPDFGPRLRVVPKATASAAPAVAETKALPKAKAKAGDAPVDATEAKKGKAGS